MAVYIVGVIPPHFEKQIKSISEQYNLKEIVLSEFYDLCKVKIFTNDCNVLTVVADPYTFKAEQIVKYLS